MPVQVRVLGAVAVMDGDGGPLPRPERKARQLLTVLVWSAPAAVSLGELSDVLWDDPPESAAKTIRAHLSRLGSLLTRAGMRNAVVAATPTSYRVNLPPSVTDVDVVAQLRRRAAQLAADGRPDSAASLLGEARRLWTSELELPPTTGALPLARAARRQRQQLVHDQLRCLVEGTDPASAIAELEALTTAEPTDEPAWTLRVSALHRSGYHVEAVAALASARRALDEIGLVPGAELRRLESAVFGDPTSAAASRRGSATRSAPASSPAPVRPEGGAAGKPAGDRGADPAVSYTSRGGHHVAYCVQSRGPRDVLVLNPAMVTIDGLFDEPRARHALTRLGEHARVICLDRSGIGLSDPLHPDADPLQRWAADVLDVIDQLDIPTVHVLASFDTGLVATQLAAHHPDRVSSLVLAHCFATYTRRPGYPYGLDPTATEQLIRDTVTPQAAGQRIETAFQVAPSAAHDETFRRWWTRIGQRGAGPGTAATIRRIATTSDVRPLLPGILAPALVVHRRNCLNLDIGHAHYLAQHLPNAQLAVIPGTDSLWFADTPHLLDRTLTFLGHSPHGYGAGR